MTMTTAIPMANESMSGVGIAPEGFQFPPGKKERETLASRSTNTTSRR